MYPDVFELLDGVLSRREFGIRHCDAEEKITMEIRGLKIPAPILFIACKGAGTSVPELINEISVEWIMSEI